MDALVQMPSQVMNEKFLRMPDTKKVVESDEEWQRCGKWTLIMSCDFEFADRAWIALQPLVKDGTLVLLKVSTALMKEEGTAVLCYTRPGKENARRAAEAIRKAVDFKLLMFYKLNKVTDEGIARRYGHSDIAKYLHTYLGRFYVKNPYRGWVLDSEDNYENRAAASPFHSQLLGTEELPSESKKDYLTIGPVDNVHVGPNWYMYSPLTKEDDGTLPEADRLWVIARRLFSEGAFSTILWRKNSEMVEIRLYVPEGSYVDSWLKHCDKIFSEAFFRNFMYFTDGNEAKIYLEGISEEGAKYYTKMERGKKVFYSETSDEIIYCTKPKQTKFLHLCMYTPEGELYEKNKFVSQRSLKGVH